MPDKLLDILGFTGLLRQNQGKRKEIVDSIEDLVALDGPYGALPGSAEILKTIKAQTLKTLSESFSATISLEKFVSRLSAKMNVAVPPLTDSNRRFNVAFLQSHVARQGHGKEDVDGRFVSTFLKFFENETNTKTASVEQYMLEMKEFVCAFLCRFMDAMKAKQLNSGQIGSEQRTTLSGVLSGLHEGVPEPPRRKWRKPRPSPTALLAREIAIRDRIRPSDFMTYNDSQLTAEIQKRLKLSGMRESDMPVDSQVRKVIKNLRNERDEVLREKLAASKNNRQHH